jgi:hypothetical protein
MRGIDTLTVNRHARGTRVMTDRGTQNDHQAAAPPTLRHNSTESRISRIARRAHEIYLARGGEHGKALEDWLQAEREVDAEMDGENVSR